MKQVKINQKLEVLNAIKAIKEGEAEFSSIYLDQYNDVVSKPYEKTGRPTSDLAKSIAHVVYKSLVSRHGDQTLFINRLGNVFSFETMIDSLRREVQNQIKRDRLAKEKNNWLAD